MRAQSIRFRMSSREAAVFESVAREHHLRKSTVIRVVCLFGPVPLSFHPEGNDRVIEGGPFYDASLLSKVLVEVIQQTTSVEQGISGFGKFLRGIGVEDISEKNIFADPERRPTMEAIVDRLDLIKRTVEEVNVAVSSLCRDSASAGSSSLRLEARVHARLEDDLLDFLRLKAEAFGISVPDYFRLCVRNLPEIVAFAREHATDDGLRLEPLCLQTIDLYSLHERFCGCGRALADAVGYLDSEMIGYYRPFEPMLMSKLRSYLARLKVAAGYYRGFCDEFGFKLEE